MSVNSVDLGDGTFSTGIPYEPPAKAVPPVAGPNPEVTSLAYNEMYTRWEMIDDLWGGTETMQQAGERWLPKMPAEDSTSYYFRLKNSSFFNAFKRTVQFLVGKAFSRPIKLSEDMPEQLKALMDDIDRQGRNLTVFLKDGLEAQVKDGHAIYFVDHPDSGIEEITVGEAKRRGLRPFVIRVDARNFLGWRSEVVDGREILTHARIREIKTERVGRWDETLTTYILVYDRVQDPDTEVYHVLWERWKKIPGNEKEPDEYISVGQGTMDPLTEIPAVPAYGTYEGFFKSKPPLEDLMFLNVDHWRSSSDQRHILHDVRVPIKFCKGFIPGQKPGSDAPAQVVIGPDRIIATTEPNADMKYVEHNGNAINSGFTDLDNIKSDMAVMGAEKLSKKQVFTTATEATHDNSAEDCELATMCRSAEDAWKQVLMYLAQYLRIDSAKVGSIEINKDFGIFPWQVQYLAYLITLNQNAKISDKTLLQMFQRFGAISDIVDIENELTEAKKDAESRPQLTTGPTQPKVPALPASPNPAGPAKP